METANYLISRSQLDIDLIPQPVIIIDVKNRIIQATNELFFELTGLTQNDIVGKREDSIELWHEVSERFNVIQMLKENNRVRNQRALIKTGNRGNVEVIASNRLFDMNGEACVITTLVDVSEQNHTENEVFAFGRILRKIWNINKLITRELDKEYMLNEICRIMIDDGLFKAAMIVMYDEVNESMQIAGQTGLPAILLNEALNCNSVFSRQGPFYSMLEKEESQTYSVEDLFLSTNGFVNELNRLGFEDFVLFPIKTKEKTFGILSICLNPEDKLGARVLDFLDDVGEDIAYAIKTREEILKRIEIEKELRISQNHLSTIFNSTSDLQMLVSVESNETFIARAVNQTYLNSVNNYKKRVTETDFIGKTINEIAINVLGFGKDVAERTIDNYLHVSKTKAPMTYEESLVISERQEICFEVKMEPVKDAMGSCNYVLYSSRDITDRKKAEKDLRISENHLAVIFNNTSDLQYLVSVEGDGSFVGRAVNSSYLNTVNKLITEVSSEDLIGHTVEHVLLNILHFNKDVSDFSVANYRKVLSSKEKLNYEEALVIDGSEYFFDVNMIPILDENEECKFILYSMRNTTEQKKSEEALRKSEERYRRIIENAAVGYVRLDKDLNYEYVNSAWEKMSGVQLTEIKGKNYSFMHSGDTLPIIESSIREVLKGEKFEGNLSRKCSKGKLHYYQYKLQPVLENNNLAGVEGFINDVTELKRAENLLKEKERILFDVIENSPLIIFLKNITGKYLLMNQTCKKLLNIVSEEQYHNKTDCEIFPDQVAKDNLKKDEYVINNKALLKYEETILLGGINHYFNTTKFPLYDNNENVIGICGISYEVTESRQKEIELIKSEKRYRELIEMAPYSMILLNEEGKVELINQKTVDMHGYSSKEQLLMQNASAFDLVADEHLIEAKKNMENYLENGAPNFIEDAVLKKKSGESFPAEVTLGRLSREEGVDSIIVIAKDTTEQKIQQRKIIENERKLKLLIDASPVPIGISNNRKEIVYLNKKFTQLFGYTIEDVPTTDIWFQKAYPDTGYREEVIKQWGEVVDEAIQNNTSFRSLDASVTCKNGEEKIISVLGAFLGDELFAVFQDLTEVKLFEKELKQSIDEKETLLKEVHHRVKNNLQVVSSLLYLQTQSVDDEEVIHKLIDTQNRVKSMSLIHKKLYESKNFAEFDVQDYVKNLVAEILHAYSFPSSNIDLKFEIENVFLSIEHAVPCGIILNELVSNTLKYAFDQLSDPKLTIKIHSDRGNIVLEVSDNGKGFNYKSENRKRSSLGLLIIERLVTQLNGQLNISKQNGTKAIITFPIETN